MSTVDIETEASSVVQQAGRAMGRAMAAYRNADFALLMATDMKCPKCGKQYKYRGWLHRHYRRKHS